ncbi:MAG: hypothetical protein LLG04_05220 [Parachlamydia sp.]|nr:hypothetical protein [Parachlamydia sp.]
MKKGILSVVLALACGALPLFGGMDETASSVGIPTQPPPAAVAEVIPTSPGASYLWVPGHWTWKGAWYWEKGHWSVRPYPQAIWIPGQWTVRHHGWVWMQGHWA